MPKTPVVRVKHDELSLGPIRVSFQRTLRIPEDGLHHLPPGLGRFPVRRISDYPDTAPAEWLQRGGVMIPLYQREAMWLSFDTAEPAALQVGVGKVCALSGEPWTERLTQEPQNYAALPDQPWLDGINSGDGFIRQFVAVPLGFGATVEAQVTGEETTGGVQLRGVGLNAEALAAWKAQPASPATMPCCAAVVGSAMGLGAGGMMRQEIYADDRALDDYDEDRDWRVFIHLCSAAQWTAITGETAPATPVDRETYVDAGLPWFDYYDADRADIPASQSLADVKTVGNLLGKTDQPHTPVDPATVITLKDHGGDAVTSGAW